MSPPHPTPPAGPTPGAVLAAAVAHGGDRCGATAAAVAAVAAVVASIAGLLRLLRLLHLLRLLRQLL